VTPHVADFKGGNALSPFRVRQLLPALQALERRISGLAARHVHFGRHSYRADARAAGATGRAAQ